jgi:undecaprenyl-diphosphatase
MADVGFEPGPVNEGGGPRSRRQHRLFAAAVVCAGLAHLALAVLAHRVPHFSIDLAITRHVQTLPAAWMGPLLGPLNALGFPPFVAIVYGSIVLLIFAVGARWEATASGFATLGAAGLNFLVKALVDRPRPPMDLVRVAHHLAGSGFPAGHVLNFTAFAGFLCYLACVRLAPSWWRTAVIVSLATMIPLMGIARIYAGEHWPSDVLGGYLLGFVWLATTIALYEWGRRRSRKRHLAR